MKNLILLPTVLFTVMAGDAIAACTGTQITDVSSPSLSTLLSGNTVCVGTNLTNPSAPWNNQEQHKVGGTLTDYKLGAGHPVDPTSDIGTWNISGSGASTFVNYNYTDGGPVSYSVFRNGASAPFTYSFCNGSNEVAVGIIYSGITDCTTGGTGL